MSRFGFAAIQTAVLMLALSGCNDTDKLGQTAKASSDTAIASEPADYADAPVQGAPSTAPTTLPPMPTIPPLSTAARLEDEQNTVAVFKTVAPSVVFVTQTRVVADFWTGSQEEVPAGSGSGFVWDKNGHIVTNYHVVAGARSLTVTLQGTKQFEATVIGTEPRKDIAVLKINAPKELLVPIQVLPKDLPVEVGHKTIAIGNPFGLDHTLTTGVVSAVGRQVEGAGGVTIRDMIQTDAAINPGNSGGPLLDSSGRLIGMNTAIYSRSGQSAGIGFAVPAGTIARAVPQIIATGHTEQVGMGINIDPSGRIERRLGVKGVVVLAVKTDSPAAKAGIEGIKEEQSTITVNDIIVGVDGKAVVNYDGLYNELDTRKPGDVVKLSVLRGNNKRTVDVKLILLEPNGN